MRLAWDDYALFMVFIAFIPCVSFTVLLLALAQARRKNTLLESKRWRFHALTIWSTPAALLLHLPFMRYYLTSLYFRIVASALFDSVLTIAKLFMGCLLGSWLIVLTVSLLAEKKFFGPPEGLPGSDATTSAEEAANKRMLALSLTLAAVVAWLVYEMLGGLLRGLSGGFICFFTFVAVWITSGRLLEHRVFTGRYSKDRQTLSPEIAERAQELAAKTSVRIDSVEIAGPGLMRTDFPAAMHDGTVRLNSRFAAKMSPPELEFLSAQAIASEAIPQTAADKAVLFASVIAILVFPILLLTGMLVDERLSGSAATRFGVHMISGLGSSFVAFLILSIVAVGRLKKRERKVIRKALELTRDYPAADSALVKIEELLRVRSESTASVGEWRKELKAKAGEMEILCPKSESTSEAS